MPLPFDKYDYLKIRDLERCPYSLFTRECAEWAKKDEERLTLIALDRYADKLQRKGQQVND